MKLLKKTLIASLLTGVAALNIAYAADETALAKPAKIGFVNTEKLLRDSIPAQEAQSRLENEFKKREADYQKLYNNLRAKYEQYDKNAAIMPDAQRKKAEIELKDLETDLQRKRREIQEDYNRRRNEAVASIVEKANQAIKEIAEKQDYDLILQEAVTVSPRVDITDDVLKLLDSSKK